MGADDWSSVVETMRLAGGGIWSIPIVLATDFDAAVGDVVELSADGKALGRMTVEEVFERDVEREAEVVPTRDDAHPGVAAIYGEGNRCIAGRIEADSLPDHDDAFQKRPRPPRSRARRSPSAAGSGSSPSRPATRSTARTST